MVGNSKRETLNRKWTYAQRRGTKQNQFLRESYGKKKIIYIWSCKQKHMKAHEEQKHGQKSSGREMLPQLISVPSVLFSVLPRNNFPFNVLAPEQLLPVDSYLSASQNVKLLPFKPIKPMRENATASTVQVFFFFSAEELLLLGHTQNDLILIFTLHHVFNCQLHTSLSSSISVLQPF